nr:hypothetical protein [uncultured Rhodopila sp.]
MSFETYWLVIAPAAILGLSGIAWAGLWLTRSHCHAPAKPLR